MNPRLIERVAIVRVEGILREPLSFVTISREMHDVAFRQCANRSAQFVVLVVRLNRSNAVSTAVMGLRISGLWFGQRFSSASADWAAL